MIKAYKIIEIFCNIDDFCKEFEPIWHARMISNKKTRNKPSKLSTSEVMTIQVLFHKSSIKTFKHFYKNYVCKHMTAYFPKLVSYNRMVELTQKTMIPMAIYLKNNELANCTGLSFIDSTPLRVCHIKRAHSHKTFKGIATKGKSSMGWFYGFKLHIVTNDQGGIIDFILSQAHVDDRKPLQSKAFIKKLFGKLYGDRGYISKQLFDTLFNNGIHLVTKLRKNMKTKLLTPMQDAYHLRHRAIIETIFDQLKNICQVEHARHRNVINYFNTIFSALIAYSFKDKKPSLKNNFVDTKQLLLFQ